MSGTLPASQRPLAAAESVAHEVAAGPGGQGRQEALLLPQQVRVSRHSPSGRVGQYQAQGYQLEEYHCWRVRLRIDKQFFSMKAVVYQENLVNVKL